MPYYERRIVSGKLLEVERYYATRDGRKISRSPNADESTDDQKRLNNVQAANRLRRILLANFAQEDGDMFVTLTMADMTDQPTAEKRWRAFLNRMKRERERLGLPECKWIRVPEQQSGRWHYHLILSGGLEESRLRKLWGHGRVTVSVLDDADNYRGLSRYLVEGHKPRRGEAGSDNAKTQRQKHKRRWSCSKNLAKPEVTKRPISQRAVTRQPKAPKGYRLLPEWTMGADKFGNLFIHYECVKTINAAAGEAPKPKAAGARRKSGQDFRRGSGAEAPAGGRAEPSKAEQGREHR